MPRYVALLRGINVGGKNTVSMVKLRATVESLGHAEVSTFIQSGNVLFTSSSRVTAKTLETALAGAFGRELDVILRTAADLRKVVRANPFAGADPSSLHVGFLARRPPAGAVKGLDSERFAPEDVAVVGTELYFHLPGGIGRAKLPSYVGRQLKIPTTVRNWKTVTKLAELADG